MFNDYWVITQLVTLLGAWILLTFSFKTSLHIIRFWDIQKNTNLQINLERKTYLVGSVAYIVLLSQFLMLILFLQTINQHLPPLIRGAMCATGTLGANSYGNLLLYIKLLSLLMYTIFLTLEYLDNLTPNFSFTPFKYYFLFPAWLFLTADVVISILYFINLTPNIITTCCSVAFLDSTIQEEYSTLPFFKIEYIIVCHFLVVLCWLLMWSFFKKKVVIKLILSALLSVFSFYTFQYYFVKYIYGLPNHFCIFDTFFIEYYGVGFVWFGAWLCFIFFHSIELIIFLSQKKIDFSLSKITSIIQKIQLFCFLIIVVLPLIYWISWRGEL
jgi:hypothetical protein